MITHIFGIGTAAAKHSVDQIAFANALAKTKNFDKKLADWIFQLCKRSRIQKRYSVVKEYQESKLPFLGGSYLRNTIYKREAPKLALQAAKKALSVWGRDCQEVTHVISVSCTGMMAPGIEFLLVDQLRLSRACYRLGLNFMGCFGAFKGLAVANSFALENPKHRILVVCTEICSLHFHENKDPNSLIANALFSDGAAAVVVGQNPEKKEISLWEVHKLASYAIENSKDEMTWEVGDHGFIMHLSKNVPLSIKPKVNTFCQNLIKNRCHVADCSWAVHPGGAAILRSIASACQLDAEEDLNLSWEVLKEFGNMSSATFLFVLEQLLSDFKKKEWTIGLGFGPGLSLEGVLLKNVFPHKK